MTCALPPLLFSFGISAGIAFRTTHLALHLDIELNLRFRTGRTDRNLRAVYSEILKYIGSLWHIQLAYITPDIGSLQMSCNP